MRNACQLSHIYILYVSYSLYFKNFILFHHLFSCNCKEVLVDICSELLFQMFRISLVQIGTVQQLHYLLKVTLMHAYSYYLSHLLGY